MSGFDVRTFDEVKRRSAAIFASVALSVVLLGTLIITRIGGDGSASAEAPPPEELQIAAADSIEMAAPDQTSLLITPAIDLTALNHAAFYEGCLICPTDRDVVTLDVPSGGTLAGLLSEAGATGSDVARAVNAVNSVFEVRYLRAGQSITVYLESPLEPLEGEENQRQLAGFSFRPDIERTITVARQMDGTFRAREMTAEFERELVRANGSITSSLYVDALAAGATDRIVVELAGILAYAVDFQRSIREGDRFDVVFERFLDGDGDVVRTGDILYAVYAGRGEPLEYFRYEAEDGQITYFNAEGESAQRLLMMTPINGARLSSHFGMRRHPVLGYNRAHRGTDFAAPTGTPVFAAGYGVVERADRFGSFGNYIRIRHSNGYHTAYAHLNGFARGVTRGARVQQGQVIGYVGTTGRSTGPHLHYEVHHNGQAVNPMALDLPTGRTLEDEEIPLFEAERDRIIAIRDSARSAAETGDTPASRIVSVDGSPGAQ